MDVSIFYLQARFHSMHVATCSSFSIDLDSPSPHPSQCIMDHPHPENGNDMITRYAEYEAKAFNTTSVKLDPRGYR